MWRHTEIVLLGGGARHRALASAIVDTPPFPPEQVQFKGFTSRAGWYSPPKDILACDLVGPAEAGDRSQFFLLGVAHGLSYHRMNWPEWFGPSAVPPLPGHDHLEPPAAEDRYPKR
jgi:hypothetical protein